MKFMEFGLLRRGSAPFTTFDWFLSFPFIQPSNVFIPQKLIKESILTVPRFIDGIKIDIFYFSNMLKL